MTEDDEHVETMYRLPVWIPPEPERPKRDHAPPDPAIVAAALETLSRPASPDILKISSRPGTSVAPGADGAGGGDAAPAPVPGDALLELPVLPMLTHFGDDLLGGPTMLPGALPPAANRVELNKVVQPLYTRGFRRELKRVNSIRELEKGDAARLRKARILEAEATRHVRRENAKLAKLAEERRVIELARSGSGRGARAKIIQHCWRSHFVRVLAPRMRKLHAASTGLKRALRAKKLRMARTKIRTFLDEIREEEGSPRNAVQHFLHSVRKSQRAIRNFSICWKARRKVCWKLWVKLEHEIREKKLASDAMAAHKRAVRAALEKQLRQKRKAKVKKSDQRKTLGEVHMSGIARFTARQINEHASQRKASAATYARMDALWAIRSLQRKQQALEILKPLPDVDDVAKRHAAVRKPDGALLLVSLGTTEVLGMVVLACRRKRRRHIAYAAELREREKVMVIDHDVARALMRASGKLNPSERDLNQLKEKAKKERRTFSWPALRLYTATNLGDTWHDIIKDLVVRDLHARRQQLANRLKSMIQPEEVERLASMLLDDDPDQTKMQDYMSSSREDLMSFSIDLTLENSSIASGSTAISKATPTSGSGPHHHHGAHVHLHHHHDAGEELARRGAGDPRAAAAPRPSGRNMVMARQPGLTVRVIRRKAEDQEADDRARENKARGDDENVDALLAATDRYRL
ncbi:hypothetical protein JL720_14232 [Aureococcus anophagefferens]|nr:hypothetical protein JL720_14232 [Aureococcus anophagefferens]